jgi:hypothetical protein
MQKAKAQFCAHYQQITQLDPLDLKPILQPLFEYSMRHEYNLWHQAQFLLLHAKLQRHD